MSKCMKRPTSRSVSIFPILPVEILEFILSHLKRSELIPALYCNSVFYNTGCRVLYRSITETSSARAVKLLKILASNDTYSRYVRSIELDFADNIPTVNLLLLLHHVLQRLHLLTMLAIDFSMADNASDLVWILEGCSFSLTSFTSSMRCDCSMARFLETQPRITELSLRGFNPLYGFELEPKALPKLEHFRTVTSCPSVIGEVLRGRPVQSVSMSLNPGDVDISLNTLLLSAATITRLTIMSFESEPVALIPLIADRLPRLEVFHLVLFMSNYTQEILLELGSSLTQFRALKYLTFIAPSTATSFYDEQCIAEAWSKACPTLRTIILPKGLVWFQRDENWTYLR